MVSTLKEWDRELLIYLNNLGTESFDDFWLFVTRIKSWIPLFALLLVVIFFLLKNRKHGSIVTLTTVFLFGVSFGIMEATKALVERMRPNNIPDLAEQLRILQFPADYSFFSGHAISGFVVTTFLVMVLRRRSQLIHLLWVWPLLFSFSRLYVGVHFPSDILVGALLGVFFAWIGYRLLGRRYPEILGNA